MTKQELAEQLDAIASEREGWGSTAADGVADSIRTAYECYEDDPETRPGEMKQLVLEELRTLIETAREAVKEIKAINTRRKA